jgi:hypothetical protein
MVGKNQLLSFFYMAISNTDKAEMTATTTPPNLMNLPLQASRMLVHGVLYRQYSREGGVKSPLNLLEVLRCIFHDLRMLCNLDWLHCS